MTVTTVNGQLNAKVILNGLLEQHGMPALTSEGIDELSARFSTGIVIGNGVVSHDGKPLINELRSILANADTAKRFFADPVADKPDSEPADNLTQRYRAEVEASRKRPSITHADLARFTGLTRQYMQERRSAAAKK